MRAVFTFLLIAASLGTANAATVGADRGIIVLNSKALTAGGHDSDPVLSPDRKHVVFTRHAVPSTVMANCSLENKPSNAVSLWIVNADGTGATRVIDGRGAAKPVQALCDFANKQFTSDGRLL